MMVDANWWNAWSKDDCFKWGKRTEQEKHEWLKTKQAVGRRLSFDVVRMRMDRDRVARDWDFVRGMGFGMEASGWHHRNLARNV